MPPHAHDFTNRAAPSHAADGARQGGPPRWRRAWPPEPIAASGWPLIAVQGEEFEQAGYLARLAEEEVDDIAGLLVVSMGCQGRLIQINAVARLPLTIAHGIKEDGFPTSELPGSPLSFLAWLCSASYCGRADHWPLLRRFDHDTAPFLRNHPHRHRSAFQLSGRSQLLQLHSV